MSDRFYAGGLNSLRGLGYQMVGPRESGTVPERQVQDRVERGRGPQGVYRSIGMVVFGELGQVWSEAAAFRLGVFAVASAADFGQHYPRHPAARLRCNVAPRDGEARAKVHFYTGHAFSTFVAPKAHSCNYLLKFPAFLWILSTSRLAGGPDHVAAEGLKINPFH